ncbi:MAG: hypothetical protein HY275_13040 [Gemmatimonadetes bacterium]|nr:hypothetical protein [Gemmatimonadota bacterium]
MFKRIVSVAILALAVAAPPAARAQDEPSAEFRDAREQFVAGHQRQAANLLLMSSLYLREQVGRSHEDATRAKLLDAESQVEKLGYAVRAGSVASVKVLDRTCMAIDRLLARHHLQMVSWVIERPRDGDVPDAARDMERAAFHFTRALTLDGSALPPEPAAAIADARALAKEIAELKAIPRRAPQVVATLERLVTATPAVIAAMP